MLRMLVWGKMEAETAARTYFRRTPLYHVDGWLALGRRIVGSGAQKL